MNGTERIAAERKRQVEVEGWTSEHDRIHNTAQMTDAAIAYALAGSERSVMGQKAWWPWEHKWWKPSDDPIRNLEKAGALIAAEIDRRLHDERGR